jgi:hypothetical protein
MTERLMKIFSMILVAVPDEMKEIKDRIILRYSYLSGGVLCTRS